MMQDTPGLMLPHDLTVDLFGNDLVMLEEASPHWLVEEGSAAVFRVRVALGQPVGPRRYLFTCQRGEVLFGDLDPQATGQYRFVAVGLDHARLCCLAPHQLAALLAASENLANPLEKWVEKLTSALKANPPPGEVLGAHSLHDFGVAAGQVFRPTQQTVCWVRLDSGKATFLGESTLPVGEAPVWLPLGTEGWLQAETDAKLTVVLASSAPRGEEATRAVKRLNDLCFAYLKAVERREADQESQRLRGRQQAEQAATARALAGLASALDQDVQVRPTGSELMVALTAVGSQLDIEFREAGPQSTGTLDPDPLPAIARAARVRHRQVLLRDGWWRADAGPLLGYLATTPPQPVALLRRPGGYYEVFNPQDGSSRRVDPELLPQLAPRAVMFYRPFPQRALGLLDLVRLGLRPYTRELRLVLVLALGATLLGMAVPIATRWIVDSAIPDAQTALLGQIGLMLFLFNLGQAALLLAQGYVWQRTQAGATGALQAAAWDRLLRLPVSFFQRFSSGDLLRRSLLISEVSHQVSGTTMRTLIVGLLSLLNLLLLLYYSPRLALLALAVAGVASFVLFGLSLGIRRRALLLEQQGGRLEGFVVQVLRGILKIRVAGAEQRTFNYWAGRYAEQLRLAAGIRWLQDLADLFNTALPTAALLALFGMAASLFVITPTGGAPAFTLGAFLAFLAAFLAFVAGVVSVGQTAVSLLDSLAKQRLLKPILEAEPESDVSRVDPGRLSGNLAAENVVFRYQPGGPLVLGGVSIVANAGELIGIVGPSGSGKSTLLRLLLGFERPESGSVTYDGKNINGLDLVALREQIGVVLQSTGVFSGPIFDNIACGHPVGQEAVWEAVRDAGLADDVSRMPMGLYTFLSEGGTTLSGGQRQRLLIARALLMNPRILLLDEATSALDNITQGIVRQSLERRCVTRVLVAHRLSTIRQADRIYVIDQGRIAEVGTYAQLTTGNSLFRRMMKRQMTASLPDCSLPSISLP